MPISVAPLAQRDLDGMFDDMRTRAGVNTLFTFIYTHEPHRAGVGAENFHGGNYARPHMKFYKDTPLTLADMRAPEFGDVDVLARVIPIARKHGTRVFPFIARRQFAARRRKTDWEKLYEVDHHGRRTSGHPGGPCFNNPRLPEFHAGAGRGLRTQLRHRRHHVGFGTTGRTAQHAGPFAEQQH